MQKESTEKLPPPGTGFRKLQYHLLWYAPGSPGSPLNFAAQAVRTALPVSIQKVSVSRYWICPKDGAIFALVSMHKFRSAGYPASVKNHEKRGFPVSKSCFYFYKILLVNIIIGGGRRIRGFLHFLRRRGYLVAAFLCMDTGRVFKALGGRVPGALSVLAEGCLARRLQHASGRVAEEFSPQIIGIYICLPLNL